MNRINRILCLAGAALSLGSLTTLAYGDGRDWNDGPVQNVSFIRTVDGHFDDYMHWLATGWKKQEEAAKKAGLIIDYHVYTAEPRSANDPLAAIFRMEAIRQIWRKSALMQVKSAA